MNMKKTIAAIAAGTVAISAMAATVSAENTTAAWGDKVVSFNLVKTWTEYSGASVKLIAQVPNVPLKTNEKLKISVKSFDTKDVIKVSGYYMDSNKPIDGMVFTKDATNPNYSWAGDNKLSATGVIEIPIVEAANQQPFTVVSEAQKAQPAKITRMTVTRAAALATPEEIAINGTTVGAAPGTAITETNSADVLVPPMAVYNGAQTMAKGTYTITFDGTDWKYDNGNVINFTVGTPATTVLKTDGTASSATGFADGDKITFAYEPYVAQDKAALAVINIEVEKKNIEKFVTNGRAGRAVLSTDETTATGTGNKILKELAEVQKEIVAGGVLGITLETVDAANAQTNVFAGANISVIASDLKNGEGKKKEAYHTNAGTKLDGTTDEGDQNHGNALLHVFQADSSTRIPQYVVSNIINDAINHYGNVTFKFNSLSSKENVQGVLDGQFGEFAKNWWDLTKDQYAFDGTNYWIRDWSAMNLYSGSLVVNGGLTFSLAQAQTMTWSGTSLSFDWDDIQSGALNPNAYTNYVQSLVLRTGNEWYWESLDLVLAEGEVEDAGSGEGDVAEPDTIDDDDVDDTDDTDIDDGDEDDGDEDDGDEDDGDEDDGDEDDGDEDDGDEDDGSDVGNEEENTSPKTGNPAVALAVIPVALAAAAVVAKKRG